MTSFQVKVAAAVLGGVVCVALFRCAVFTNNAASCMRHLVIDLGLWSLHWAALVLAIWLGYEAYGRRRKLWVGWVVGIAVWLLLMLFLTWMGFELPKSENSEDDTDFNYRR